ncbi:MAG: CPBP family intramembrane metalloprotease [Planctomycetes bacterium]|nr:CPBP family intramembrane metalloprotease [Planctomycetota bacterium]
MIGALDLGAGDLLLFGAGTVLLLLYLGLRIAGRDPLAGNPSPPGRARELEAFAVLLLSILVQVFVAGGLAAVGRAGETTIVLAATAAATAVAGMAALMLLRGAGPAGPAVRGAGAGVLGFVASFPVVATVLLGWKALLSDLGGSTAEQPILTSLRADLPVFFLVAVIGAPLSEEIIFRGLLHGALRRRFGMAVAAIISAAIWAAVHRHLPTAPAHFVLGVALSLTYEKTGTLWGPIAFHAAFNGWQFAQVAAGGR